MPVLSGRKVSNSVADGETYKERRLRYESFKTGNKCKFRKFLNFTQEYFVDNVQEVLE